MDEQVPVQDKDIPNEPKPMPAMDENRRENANLAPQGVVNLDEVTNGHFTPEGDGESVPNIPDHLV